MFESNYSCLMIIFALLYGDHIFLSNANNFQNDLLHANKTYGEKAWQQLHKNAASNTEQILEEAPDKAAAVRPLTTHHENYQNWTNQTYGTLREK